MHSEIMLSDTVFIREYAQREIFKYIVLELRIFLLKNRVKNFCIKVLIIRAKWREEKS